MKQPGAYLIHFDRKLKHAQHYLSSAADIPSRISAHRDGSGARLIAAIQEQGIGWQIARIWPTATRELAWQTEIALKNRRDAPRICPVCNPGTTRAAVPEPAARRTGPRHPPVRKTPAGDFWAETA
jgi:predicted GIY-YIG superfamily endonuclease